MTENPESQHPTGGWPVTNPVDLGATEQAPNEPRDKQEHGEQYTQYQAALAWNELVLDNIRLDLEKQPSDACKRSRTRWWITGVLAQLDTVLKGHE